MQYSIKREFYILFITVVFILCVLGGYLSSISLLFFSLPFSLYLAIKAPSPVGVLIPFAIIVTWGAEIWNTAYSSLYTLLKLSILFIFFVRVFITYSHFCLTKFFLPIILFVIYNLVNESLRFPGDTDYMFYVNIIICYTVVYLASRYSTIEDFDDLSLAIGMGVFFSAVIALVSPFIPSLLSIVVEMIQTDNSFGGDVIENRFSSLAYDPNLFGMYVDCALSLNLIVLIRRQFKQSVLRLLLCCCLIVVGLMTLSKSYFLVTALLLFYSFRQILKSKYMKTQRKVIITTICLIIAGVLSYYFADYVDALLSRFDSKNASNLTTGRSDLASYYINYIFDNWDVLFFGKSLLGSFNNFSTPHNFAIYLVFYFGLFGSLIFIFHILNIISLNKRYRLKSYSYLLSRNLHYIPLVVYLLYSFTIDPFALYDMKMIMLTASFAAWFPLLKNRI